MLLKTCIQTATEQLAMISDTAQLDAEILISHCLKADRSICYSHPERKLTPEQLINIDKAVEQRQNGCPIAYIVGNQPFWSLDFFVNEHVLIPRPETEHLVEWILSTLPKKTDASILELGTGSGCIAISLAHERPHWHIIATELSPLALQMAEHNRDLHQITNLTLVQAEKNQWYPDTLPQQRFNVIVSNPPYIGSQEPEIVSNSLSFEPITALVAGNAGLSDLQNIIAHAQPYLCSKGWLVVEHGYRQGNQVRQLFEKHSFKNIKTLQDYQGHERVSLGQKII